MFKPDPNMLEKDLERLYDGIAFDNCGVKLVEIPDNYAGGVTYIRSGEPVVTIVTIPQAEYVWGEVVSMFECPWLSYKPIKEYIKKNNLFDAIIKDDRTIKEEIYAKFRRQLINWAYNKVWDVYSEVYVSVSRQSRQSRHSGRKGAPVTVPTTAPVTEPVTAPTPTPTPSPTPTPTPNPTPTPTPTTTQTTTKPIHKNKPFVGGAAITAASFIMSFVHAHLPAPIATAVAGIIVMILSAIEHKEVA